MTAPAWAPWAAVLDRLEADVTRAEQLADDPTGPATEPGAEPWSAPTDAGPMPTHLIERAQDILARQRLVQDALAMSMNAAVRQLEFTAKVDRATRRTDPALFVDITA